MKMDIDCIRDILLQAEDKRFAIFNNIPGEDNNENKINLLFIKKYNDEKLLYHIYLATELGLLKITQFLSGVSIDDLSAQGHLFLADIRDDNVWNKTKEISKEVGSTSFDAIKQISVGVISTLISNYFQK